MGQIDCLTKDCGAGDDFFISVLKMTMNLWLRLDHSFIPMSLLNNFGTAISFNLLDVMIVLT